MAGSGYIGAACSQLFIVVEAREQCSPREPKRGKPPPERVSGGKRGDLHETRSENGLVAIVVEAEDLNPATREPRPTGQGERPSVETRSVVCG